MIHTCFVIFWNKFQEQNNKTAFRKHFVFWEQKKKKQLHMKYC